MSFIIDTAINGQGDYAGKAYFFKGNQYVRYDWNSQQVDTGYPMNLSEWNLPEAFQVGLHAALNGAGQYAGKAYFFRGDQYMRYDWSTNKIDDGYPLNLSAWNLPAQFLSGIDAAINGYGTFAGKAYFFKDQEYVRYDWTTERIDEQGVLPLAAWQLASPCSWRVDAALEGQGRYAGKAFFFRDGVYVRYDWLTQSCDSDYPRHIDFWKLPETFLYPSGKIRDHIWYVTIDDYDYFQSNNLGHANNLRGLQGIAEKVGVQADPIWMANLRDEFLKDGTLLALFGAGSFSEWFLAASRPDWRQYLDGYCKQIQNTEVPILGVCGSHQLIGRAFADWNAVGHMARADQPIPTMADEFEQNLDLIPRPRLGEVGIFPFRMCAGQERDPLLAGLPSNPQFLEYHHDQVVTGRHPSFQVLLEPHPNGSPEFWIPNDANHMNPPTADDCCRVQTLRLNASGRVLYTTQFHPEVPVNNPDVDWQAEQLITNFIGIARSFWVSR